MATKKNATAVAIKRLGKSANGITAGELNAAMGRKGKQGLGPMKSVLNRLKDRGILSANGVERADMPVFGFAEGVTIENVSLRLADSAPAKKKPNKSAAKKLPPRMPAAKKLPPRMPAAKKNPVRNARVMKRVEKGAKLVDPSKSTPKTPVQVEATFAVLGAKVKSLAGAGAGSENVGRAVAALLHGLGDLVTALTDEATPHALASRSK